MSESAPSQNPKGWKATNLSSLIVVTREKRRMWRKLWLHLWGSCTLNLRSGCIWNFTSCAHQAQPGWIRRHSSQDVALPLIHMLRPEKVGKDQTGRVTEWDYDGRITNVSCFKTDRLKPRDQITKTKNPSPRSRVPLRCFFGWQNVWELYAATWCLRL